MEWIRAWVWHIVGIIMLSSVCEMLVPGGEMKKYVNLVIGLILVINVIRPLVNVPTPTLSEIEFSAQKQNMTEFRNNLDAKEQFNVMKIYKAKLCEKLKKELKLSLDIDAEIAVDAEENDEKRIGEIKGVTVMVYSENEQNDRTSQIKREVVKTVKIPEQNVKVHILKKRGEA